MNTASTSQPAYPLPAPEHVADVLQRNGFPRLTGTDQASLMIALGGFLYPQKETP